jgi:hypothetical protein
MTENNSNPEHDALERLIRTEIWPGIVRIFEGMELNADTASEDGRPSIDVEPGPETAASFIFLVSSDEDPWSEDGRSPYFCRFKVTCRPHGYMLGRDFYIHFPEETDMNRLRPLLGNPMFVGNPPSLVCETGHGDLPGALVVGFRHGHGYGHGTDLPVPTMLADLAEGINYLRRTIRAVLALSEDFSRDKQLTRLVWALEKCFPAY